MIVCVTSLRAVNRGFVGLLCDWGFH